MKTQRLALVSSTEGFWAHFNIVTYLLTYLLTKALSNIRHLFSTRWKYWSAFMFLVSITFNNSPLVSSVRNAPWNSNRKEGSRWKIVHENRCLRYILLLTQYDVGVWVQYPERVYRTMSGAMCLDFSKANPNLLAVSFIIIHLCVAAERLCYLSTSPSGRSR